MCCTAIAILFFFQSAFSLLFDYPSYPLNMPDVSFTYDIADRLVSMTQGNNTTSWDYNEAYELIALSTPQGGLEYEYDNLGRLWKLIKNTNQVTEYRYDDASRLVSVLNPYNELTEFEYDDDSKLIRKLFANGTKEEYSYDERNRLVGIVLKKSNNDVLSSHQYVYDAVSNIVQRTSNGVTTEFTYDLIDQLRTETRNDYEAEYTYDANGNRLTRTVSEVTEEYAYDDADKLLSVSINENPVKEYTYDACGRLIEVEAPNQQITQLHWDYEDRLIGITYPNSSTNTFGYNGFGARISKSDSTGNYTFFRSGTSVISPILSDGNATYTPGISERRNNSSTFYHSDIKNTTTQTASNETISGTNQYDAFGNLIDYSDTWNGPFTYGGAFGYQTDDDSGLMLLGHRYYDSSTGRFLSRDPIGDGANWYVYCNNNPVNYFDYSGEVPIPALVGGALFVGGLLWAAYDIWTNPDDPMSYVSAIPITKLAKLGIFMKKVIDPVVDGISKGGKAKKGGETAATARGRLKHAEHEYGPGYNKRHNLPSGRRPDAVNVEKGHVFELKPNNPKAIKKGEKQLQEYLEELKKLYPEKDWTGTVITYD
jgi:RHS repeat-associated protein